MGLLPLPVPESPSKLYALLGQHLIVMLRRSQAPLQMLVSRLVRYEHHELTGQASRLLVAAHAVLDADVAERLASSASASTSYSTSSLHVASCAKAAASHSGALPSCSQASFQQTRGYARPAAPPMPYHIAKLVLQTVDKPKQREVPPLEPRPYTPESKRSGLIAVKAGMTQTWDEWGVRVPLTVLWVDECEVVRVKTAPCDGVNALVLGVGTKKEKRLRKAQLGEYRSAGIAPKAKLAEFQVTPDGLLPAGTKLRAAHFIAGRQALLDCGSVHCAGRCMCLACSAMQCMRLQFYCQPHALVHTYPVPRPHRDTSSCVNAPRSAPATAPRSQVTAPHHSSSPSKARIHPLPPATGQHVDVTGVSKGKGFQGVMKRWGFAGGPASHGATKVGAHAQRLGWHVCVCVCVRGLSHVLRLCAAWHRCMTLLHASALSTRGHAAGQLPSTPPAAAWQPSTAALPATHAGLMAMPLHQRPEAWLSLLPAAPACCRSTEPPVPSVPGTGPAVYGRARRWQAGRATTG